MNELRDFDAIGSSPIQTLISSKFIESYIQQNSTWKSLTSHNTQLERVEHVDRNQEGLSISTLWSTCEHRPDGSKVPNTYGRMSRILIYSLVHFGLQILAIFYFCRFTFTSARGYLKLFTISTYGLVYNIYGRRPYQMIRCALGLCLMCTTITPPLPLTVFSSILE